MSLKKSLKRVGRKVQAVGAKVVKYATPVLSAAGSLIAGPAVGAALGAAGTAAERGLAGTAARAKGLKGLEARQYARKEMQKTLKMSAVGAGAGVAGAGIAGLFGAVSGGGGLLGGVSGGLLNIFGVGGSSGLSGLGAAADQAPGAGWEEGGYLSTLYGSGRNVSGTSLEASTGSTDYMGALLAGGLQALNNRTKTSGGSGGGAGDRGGRGGGGKDDQNGPQDGGDKILGLPKEVVYIGAGLLAVVALSGNKAA